MIRGNNLFIFSFFFIFSGYDIIKKITVKNPNHLPTTSYKNLKDLQGNLKTISKENLEKLKQSIIKYGIFVPKFVWIENNKNYWIEDGHQTIKALVALEKEDYVIPDIPYVKVECENKKDAAEKLLQINSRYGIINPDTTFFEDFNIDLSFINDIEIPELDIKLEELEPEIVEDEVPEPPIEPLSKTGDLWLCGDHRVLCGDATKEADILKLMDGKKVDLLFTDPPYGINVVSHENEVGVTGGGKLAGKGIGIVKARIYRKIIGDNKPFEPKFLLDLTKTIILFGANNYASKLPDNSHWIVWDKKCERGADRNFFSDVELLWTNVKRKSYVIYRHLWSGLLREGDRASELTNRVHPTQKPVGLCSDIIKDYSEDGDKVLDLYLGSGTILIAAEQTNHILYGTELDPHYIDVILDRYAKFTGDDPIRESDGVKWSELNKRIQM